MIEDLLNEGYTREEVRAILVANGIAPNEARAEFMIAVALGEIDGDLVDMSEVDGEEE